LTLLKIGKARKWLVFVAHDDYNNMYINIHTSKFSGVWYLSPYAFTHCQDYTNYFIHFYASFEPTVSKSQKGTVSVHPK
jgi:hypothetical protein